MKIHPCTGCEGEKNCTFDIFKKIGDKCKLFKRGKMKEFKFELGSTVRCKIGFRNMLIVAQIREIGGTIGYGCRTAEGTLITYQEPELEEAKQ